MRRFVALGLALAVILVAAVGLATRDDSNNRDGADGVPDGARGVAIPRAEGVLSATGRSVHTDAALGGMRTVHLAGAQMTVRIAARTKRGGTAPTGQVTVLGTDVTIESTSPMSLDGPVLIRGNEVSVDGGLANRSRIVLAAGQRTTVRGAQIVFSIEGRTTRPRGSFTFIAAPGARPVGHGEIEVREGSLRWVDAPKSFQLRDEVRSITSWAGAGSVTIGKRRFSHEFGAFAAADIVGKVTRSGGSVKLSGRGLTQQVYLDGAPQLSTKASVDLVQISEETTPGAELELTWAPRNVGDFDMVMTRIVPVGPAAGWLSFGLEPAPFTFGGELRPLIGGKTAGFRPGLPIRSVLPPRDADRRDIGVAVPGSNAPGRYDATVRIEGNFPSVSVPFEVIVQPREPRSTPVS